MVNDRLIYAEQAKTLIKNYGMGAISDGRQMLDPVDDIILLAGGVDLIPAVDAVEVPCKIGDSAWAIRNFKGHKHPQRGIVGDMFFTNNMKLMIVVKYVARGEWGKTVFATYEEACAAIGAKMDGGAEDGTAD